MSQYLVLRPGTLRPFGCSECSYRSNLMVLLKGHVLKKHLGGKGKAKQIENVQCSNKEVKITLSFYQLIIS